jgi:hypothetical protein
MFAKHLLQSVSYKRPQPTFTPSNTGEYIDPTTGRRYRVVIEGTAIRVYRRGTNAVPATYISSTTTNAAGVLALVPTGGNIELWQADNQGPQSLVGTLPPLGASPHFISPNLALHALVISGGRRITPHDLGTGAVGANIDTSVNLAVFLARDAIYFVPNATTMASGTNPRTILPASGGRNVRCKIEAIDDSAKPLCYRVVAGAGIEPVTFSPWRRPLTVDTRARAFGWSPSAGGVNGLWSVRGGISRRVASVSTREIEVGPSTGIVEIPSGRCSRHVVSVYEYVNQGVLSFEAGSVEYVNFGDQLRSGTIAALQYMDAGDTPTGEFIIEASQSWPNLQSGTALTTGGISQPETVAMDGLVRMPSGSSTASFYDYDGDLIRSATPSGGGIGASAFLLQNANLFGTTKSTGTGGVLVTADAGVTWTTMTIGGGVPPAGYTLYVSDPGSGGIGGLVPAFEAGQLFDPRRLSGWQPLFIT